MYSLTPKLAEYLLTHAKDPEIPGLYDGEDKPFTAKNLHSIGIIDPYNTIGTDFDYIIHTEFEISSGDGSIYIPNVKGCWLYRRDELSKPNDPVIVQRGELDPYTTKIEDDFDITDCCVTFPSPVERITATKIESLEKLLEREPGIKKCIDQTKDHNPWFAPK